MNIKAATPNWARWTLTATLCGVMAAASANTEDPQAPLTAPRSKTQQGTTDQLIVKYRDGSADVASGASPRLAALQAIASRHGVQLSYVRSTSTKGHVLRMDRRLPMPQVEALARDIAAHSPEVRYAEPDRLAQPQFVPNDTSMIDDLFTNSGNDMNLSAAWDKSTGTDVVVAVLDSGHLPHPDLVANIVGGYDFVSAAFMGNDGDGRDGDAQDPGNWEEGAECGAPAGSLIRSNWHGTSVAGLVAAVGNNNAGVAGVAFGAKVLSVRVTGKCGGYVSDIFDGLVWASGVEVDGVPKNHHPARVINMSLASDRTGSCTEGSIKDAIDAANSRGAVVVVSAGNNNADTSRLEPANCPGVIAVAAAGGRNGKASYSSFGSHVALAVPTGDGRQGGSGTLVSLGNRGVTTPETVYTPANSLLTFDGTSASAPVVAGVAALMLSRNPALTPAEVKMLLLKTVRPFPLPCHGCGPGLVDAAAAVDAAISYKKGSLDARVQEWELNNPQNISNDKVEFAQLISGNSALVTGSVVSDGDVDFYRIDVPPGHTLSAVLAEGTGHHELRLYQHVAAIKRNVANGFEQVHTVKELTTAVYGDSVGTFAPRRIVWSRGSDASVAGDGFLVLHETLYPVFYVSVQNKAGSAGPAGRYQLSLATAERAADGSAKVDEVEANGTLLTAQEIRHDHATVTGAMDSGNDSDYFKFLLPRGKTLAVLLEQPERSASSSTASDYDLYLHDDTGRQISSSLNTGGTGEHLAHANDGSGSGDLALYAEVRYKRGPVGGRYKLRTQLY